jgi:hypothetical protein
MAFDHVQIDENRGHLNNDLDVVREGTEVKEIVEREIEGGLIF